MLTEGSSCAAAAAATEAKRLLTTSLSPRRKGAVPPMTNRPPEGHRARQQRCCLRTGHRGDHQWVETTVTSPILGECHMTRTVPASGGPAPEPPACTCSATGYSLCPVHGLRASGSPSPEWPHPYANHDGPWCGSCGAPTRGAEIIADLRTQLAALREAAESVAVAYDNYRGRGVIPAPTEYRLVVEAIDHLRAALASPAPEARS